MSQSFFSSLLLILKAKDQGMLRWPPPDPCFSSHCWQCLGLEGPKASSQGQQTTRVHIHPSEHLAPLATSIVDLFPGGGALGGLQEGQARLWKWGWRARGQVSKAPS